MAQLFKRALDVVGSLLLLVLLSPVMLAIAVWIRTDSRGPALYRQRRAGKDGQPFFIVKFRTMTVGADKTWTPPGSTQELETFYFQTGEDPRVTRVGRFLRERSLDELPNLWNVLVGDMSLVGPRPEVPEIVALYDDRMKERLRVKPGITGLAQISGRGELSTAETIRYDLQYCQGWNFWSDIRILLKTLGTVNHRDGAM